jgi:hypothetical protein
MANVSLLIKISIISVDRIAKATKSILKPEIRQNLLSQESGRTVKNK